IKSKTRLRKSVEYAIIGILYQKTEKCVKNVSLILNVTINRANYGKHLGETTPVSEYPANDYGVHDIAGNIWEWCLDGYQADFYANSPRRNPTAGANNVDEIVNDFENIVDFRVIRGGGWNSNPEWLRASNRHGTSPAYAGIGALGFRCAKRVSP
ncbi:formylglycine-generating enzyme family protein, partial [Candidatus Poribacteria bacterium]|nr:formylglycine-generating enzyme family protein [Candidatus Poribacteria bacterium]